MNTAICRQLWVGLWNLQRFMYMRKNTIFIPPYVVYIYTSGRSDFSFCWVGVCTVYTSTVYSILWNACCSWAAGTGAEELLSTQQDVASEKIIAYSVFYIIKFTQYFTLSSLLSILHCKFFSVFYIIKFAMYFTLYPFLLNFFYCFLHSNLFI